MMDDQVVFATPWFELVARRPEGYREPHYSIRAKDYVVVVATRPDGRLILVRQFRPAVGRVTLELPAGHVETGETPEQAARKELREETGYAATSMELLGTLLPDTGRLGNRLWCFLAAAGAATEPDFRPEPGVEPAVYERTLDDLLTEPDFTSALNLAALFLAVAKGRLTVGAVPPVRGREAGA